MKKLIVLFNILFLFQTGWLNPDLSCQTKASKRVISLLPSYTEIIFELGAEKSIVGVTNYCNWPYRAKDITKVGDYLNPNIEMIYKLNPDIVFIGDWKNDKIKDFATKKNIKLVIIPSEEKVEDIFRTIMIIGENLGVEDEAKKLIKKLEKRLNEIKKYSDKNFKKVYVELDKDMWTCGSKSFISDVILKLGGKNIFYDIKKSYFKTNWEEVVKRNPDVIFVLSGSSASEISSRQMALRISAVRNSKVIVFNNDERDIFLRPSPRIFDLMEKLKSLIDF